MSLNLFCKELAKENEPTLDAQVRQKMQLSIFAGATLKILKMTSMFEITYKMETFAMR